MCNEMKLKGLMMMRTSVIKRRVRWNAIPRTNHGLEESSECPVVWCGISTYCQRFKGPVWLHWNYNTVIIATRELWCHLATNANLVIIMIKHNFICFYTSVNYKFTFIIYIYIYIYYILVVCIININDFKKYKWLERLTVTRCSATQYRLMVWIKCKTNWHNRLARFLAALESGLTLLQF